ncbi:MAG: DUF2207 domain-containing protein [Clostridia bacterium]|nr:DUF2207 domain-containing protein [Clostridia bacterium]MDD4386607.1 DUF2207 domain-containing protein [Clostridia bacterium]
MNKIIKLIFVILAAIMIISIALYVLKHVFNFRTLTITNFDIQALVEKDGDIKVNLLNEYKFNGKYNGVYITLPKDINDISSFNTTSKSINDSILTDTLYGNTDIKNFKVYLIKDGIDIELKEVDYANLGDRYVYTKEVTNGYIKYMMYEPSSDETKSFRISYTLVNTGVKHIDAAEIYWNFIGGNYECKINKLNIDLKFESPSQIKYSYTHGNQSGKLTINGDSINVQYSNINAKQFVALRVLFDNSSIPFSNKFSKIQAIPIVLDQEKVLQDRTDMRILINNIFIIITVILVLYYIYLLVKYEYDKLFMVYYDDEYKLLDKYNPMILACIAQNREMNARDIIAVLLDLVNKKVLKMEVIPGITKKTYMITKIPHNIVIDDIERNIINLFFGNTNKIELQSKIKELNKDGMTVEKIKIIDTLAITKLSELGANSVKVSTPLLAFNNILFAIICVIITINMAFNISLANSTLSRSITIFNSDISGIFIAIIISTLTFLPMILYIIYFLLYLFRCTQKYIVKIAFKFSAKKLIASVITFTIISSAVFTLLFLTTKSEYVIINTVMFMVALLIIMTDNLMSKHDIKIYKIFLSLKIIQDKLENGSLLEEKKIGDILLWEKYLTFAIALGITNVSQYANGLEIQDDLSDFLSQINDFLNIYYDISGLDRDINIDNILNNFKNMISSFSSSYLSLTGSNSGSSFGGGGFSGGGGSGGRWWRILTLV